MIVVDASVVLAALLRPTGERLDLGTRLLEADSLGSPHLVDLEVTQTLRRFILSEQLSEERARAALADFAALPLERFSHTLLLPRIWELRNNLTAYDGSYVALTELLEAELWTVDRRMARAAAGIVPVQDLSPPDH